MEMPKKWPEKLKALDIECGELVDNKASVYSAMRLISESDDTEHNFKKFSIRQHPSQNDELYVWRTA